MPLQTSIWHIAALSTGVLITSLSQVLLRLGAKDKKTWLGSFLNLKTALGYSLFVIVVLLTTFASQGISMRAVVAWNSAAFLSTILMARLFLKERVSRGSLAGIVMIIIGLVVFSIG